MIESQSSDAARHMRPLDCAGKLPQAAVADRTQKGRNIRIRFERKSREKPAQVRLGSYEFRKKGISRFDLRDPYHLAIALTWPQFPATLLTLYLSVIGGSRFSGECSASKRP
jgi:hypothetical protein